MKSLTSTYATGASLNALKSSPSATARNYRLRIPAPCGQLEVVVDDPVERRRGIALIAHPHPLHGGTLDNKVVQTLAKTLLGLGYVAVRPNFRGVGKSDGEYGGGEGEAEDMLAAARFAGEQFEEPLPFVLAGFSFGAFVQSQVVRHLPGKRLVLVAPAVNMFDFGPVPPDTVVIAAEDDELVPLASVEAWARPLGVEVSTVPGAGHFFHRRLDALSQTMIDLCRC